MILPFRNDCSRYSLQSCGGIKPAATRIFTAIGAIEKDLGLFAIQKQNQNP